MNKTLDENIFDEFVKIVNEKRILTDSRLPELKKFINKTSVSAEDWDLLADKECLPKQKVV